MGKRAIRNIQQVETNALGFLMLKLEKQTAYQTVVDSYNKLLSDGWDIYVVKQVRGHCWYGSHIITVPLWAFERSEAYVIYYLCHEMAHAFAGYEAAHGPAFMAMLKRICPAGYLHFETGYKLKEAVEAGIMPEDF